MVIKFYDYRAMIVLGYIKFMSNQVVIKLLLQLKSYINFIIYITYKNLSRSGRRACIHTVHFIDGWIDVCNHGRSRYLIQENEVNQVLHKEQINFSKNKNMQANLRVSVAWKEITTFISIGALDAS